MKHWKATTLLSGRENTIKHQGVSAERQTL